MDKYYLMICDDLYLDIKRGREEGLFTIFINTRSVETDSSMETVVDSVENISKELIFEIEQKDFEK